MSMESTESLVAEINRNFERTKERTASLAQAAVTANIAGVAGRVVVNGFGKLRAVELDPDGTRHMTAAGLAAAIVAAVNSAEDAAAALRRDNPVPHIEGVDRT